MCAAIAHRGPDDEGHQLLRGAALGMRRLSIIDVAGGMQPIANEDGTVHVVFNGEIYNHHALRSTLERQGHTFGTRSDTEVLVHLYEEHGSRMVEKLRGMFAFAIWDSPRQRLLLARDRFGIKPLYYAALGSGLLFGSELRSFLALPEFARELDQQAIASYLSLGYVPEPLSVFSGVRKLPPGHLLTWDESGRLEVAQYWSAAAHLQAVTIDEGEAIRELRRLLLDAVESHLESEVPLGAFLSGGLDSSTVVALMASTRGRRVRTFSIGFDERDFNEAPDARVVAETLGTEHRELIVRPDADALVEEVIQAFDEPFADSSALPTYLVAQLAREEVTVALSGDGGDELFGGYTRYTNGVALTELHAPARQLLNRLAHLLPNVAPGRNRLLDLARTREGRYAAMVALPLSPRDGGIARPGIASLVPALDGLLAKQFTDVGDRDFATRMMAVDIATYLPGDILTKVDRTSMAVSLEARVPLLDHHLAEFVLSLPSSFKIRGGVGKSLFRKAVTGLIPDVVLSKPKQGFALPLARWFRRELRYRIDALLRPDARIYEYVDPAAVLAVAAEHRIGRRDHSTSLWRLLVLETWVAALASGRLARPLKPSAAQLASAGGVHER